jgi:hypothetical protein
VGLWVRLFLFPPENTDVRQIEVLENSSIDISVGSRSRYRDGKDSKWRKVVVGGLVGVIVVLALVDIGISRYA